MSEVIILNILVIFTGGTIGSRVKDGWISPDRSTKYTLVENFEKENGKNVSFTCIEPYFLLSENLSAKELNILIKNVKENLQKDFDGIIVTHGTDTLHYSAAALSFAVGSDTLPIILVSANYPLDDVRSNGNDNFKAAVDFIMQKKGKGVFISYKNRFEDLKFHRGLGVSSYKEADDRVYSLYDRHFADYKTDGIRICQKGENLLSPLDFVLCEKPKILSLTAMPADSFEYDLKKYRAVIIRPYHSGTLDTANEDFKSFCKRAAALGVPVFAVNIHSGTAYESAQLFSELHIIPLENLSFADAYMRLWIGISRQENLKNLF